MLSPSAAAILATVDGSSSIAEIAASVADEMGLAEADLIADVGQALDAMEAENLITFGESRADSPPGEPSLPTATSSAAPDPVGSTAPAAPTDQPDQSARDVRIGPFRVGPFRVGAATAVVLVQEPELATHLDEPLRLLPPCPPGETADARIVVSKSHDGRFHVSLDEVPVATADTPAAAVDAVLGACNRIASTRSAGAVRLHGGAVARDGRAVAICGTSGSGKSTLVAALVGQGWQYLTDEVVIVDPLTLGITAYPKWIDLAPDAAQNLGLDAAAVGSAGRKLHLPPASIGTVGDSARLAAILLLDHHGDVPPDDPFVRLSAPDAVEALLGQVFVETFDGDDGLARVVDVCAGIPVGVLLRDSLDAMTATADRWLADAVRPS